MKIDSINHSSGDHHHRLRRRSPPLKFSDSSVSIPFRFGEDNTNHRRLRNASVKSGGEEGIEEFRVKIMSDLKTVRDKITQSLFNKKDDVIEEQEEIDGSGSGSGQEKEETEISLVKPWNLRKRRAACNEPVSGNQYNSFNKGFVIEERVVVNPSPLRGGVIEAETKKIRPKFAVKLSKKEIEEDYMALLGHRPPRRPKKRPRTAQKILDVSIFGFIFCNLIMNLFSFLELI